MIGEGREKKPENTFSWMYRDDRQDVSGEIRQVYLEVTTACNLSCRSCVRFSIENFHAAPMEMSLFSKILEELRHIETLERIVLLGFGEALCHPSIADILRGLRTIKTEIVLVTNASFLSEELPELICSLPLDRVVVSWDDAVNGSKNIIRRGKDPGKSSENISRLIKCKNKNEPPAIGMQIVAMKSNIDSITEIIDFGDRTGIDHFLVSNLFPYSEAMQDEILYSAPVTRKETLRNRFRKYSRLFSMEVAASEPDRSRKCPFIEKGTVFITAMGEIAPCPELAYTHNAWYYGSPRIHNRKIFGSLSENSISGIWLEDNFDSFRRDFKYWDLPDCSSCEAQGDCSHRHSGTDCYRATTPCGECLWAKEIIICP